MSFIIKRPIISEKNSGMADSRVYVFEVDERASKPEIKAAAEKLFKIKVESVRTVVCRTRQKPTKFSKGALRYWKKAMIQLSPGEKLQLFEGA